MNRRFIYDTMSYMKRTVKQNSALPDTGIKTKKAAPLKTAKAEIPAVTKKNTAPAENPLKKITAKSSAKVSSAPVPKAKKPASNKIAAPVKPNARKKNGVFTETKNTKNPKPVIAAKASVSALKPEKSAVSSVDKSKNKKVVEPVLQKTVKLKKEQILPKSADKKSKTAEKKAEIVVSEVKQKKIRALIENKPATVTVSSKAKTSAPKVSKQAEVIVPAKTQKLKTKLASAQKAVIISAANNQKAKVKAATTARKIEVTAPVTKPKAKREIATVEKKTPKIAAKKIETIRKNATKSSAQKIEQKIEIVVPPVVVKPVKKKLKPIGSAVVRGKSGKYDFEVFPLDAELKDGSAIYVISKRITDKSGRGHHKFVCIGQTESLLGEIKRHKKDKCIKQHNANVICLLREESAANRLKIETDLREAHSIACNQK